MQQVYRVGVIGSTGRGNYGHGIDTCWKAVPQTKVVAVADDNEAGRAAAAKRLGVDQAFADYRKMIETVKPDIVAIAPRWIDQHHAMMMAAAERGIHVYIEKPFCRTPAEADEIIAACEKTHAQIAISHPTRYSPKLDAIRKLIKEGELGTVLEYRARGKEDRRGGAEDLWVLGSHMLDLIRELAGKPEWCFATMKQNGKLVTKADVKEGNEGVGLLAGDHVQAVYQMPNNVQAFWASRKNMAGNPRRYGVQIFGSKGILEIYEGVLPDVYFLPDSSWSPGRSKKEWLPVSSAGIGKPEPLTDSKYTERHSVAILDLLHAIENQGLPKCNMYEGRGIVEMIMAVFESHRLGQPVNFPLTTRTNPLALLK